MGNTSKIVKTLAGKRLEPAANQSCEKPTVAVSALKGPQLPVLLVLFRGPGGQCIDQTNRSVNLDNYSVFTFLQQWCLNKV